MFGIQAGGQTGRLSTKSAGEKFAFGKLVPRDGYVSNPFVANTGTYADDASLAVNARCVGQLLSDAKHRHLLVQQPPLNPTNPGSLSFVTANIFERGADQLALDPANHVRISR